MLSTEAQMRYLIQWFHEWSDLQRSDFLPIMAEKYTNKAYVNGIVNSIANVNCREKPMSLFECRVSTQNFRLLFYSITFRLNCSKSGSGSGALNRKKTS
jgi:hypothetical protein